MMSRDARSSPATTLTATGTFCKGSTRFCEVTTIVCNSPLSFSSANVVPGMIIKPAAIQPHIERRFMSYSPLL